MSNLDRLKADISFHEKMFFSALAVMMGVIGWAASNFLNVPLFVMVFALLGVLSSVIFAVFQYRFIKKLIKELGNA